VLFFGVVAGSVSSSVDFLFVKAWITRIGSILNLVGFISVNSRSFVFYYKIRIFRYLLVKERY